jgi:carboxypeptidase family protein
VTEALIEWTGRVVDIDGTPVPLASVVIVAGSVPMPELALLTDEDGRFRLRLPRGRFTLRAHAPGASGEARVDATGAGGEILIVVEAETINPP